MTAFSELDRQRLNELHAQLRAQYAQFKGRGLALDMTRGKPCPEQLDLAAALSTMPDEDDYHDAAGVDCRNYGGLDGLAEMKALFGNILGLPPAQVIVGGNASLNLMHNSLVRAMLFGVPGGGGPWKDQGRLKFLCPAPGYDRHFAITEHLGFELLPIPMTECGPDMDAVESAAADADVKGIWCVPKYSNPTGATYSREVVLRLADMPTGAPDFRIMWDNAYAEHHFTENPDTLADLAKACHDAGHANRYLMFASTSKMSLPGAGVAALAAGPENIADARRHLAVQTIGPDKMNQLRHLRFFRDLRGLRHHMARHAKIIAPKFARVRKILGQDLKGSGIARWTDPKGGYFVSLDVVPGCASQVVEMARGVGVKLTQAGATFPMGRDPDDRNIRIAPSFPSITEVGLAMQVLTTCVKLSAIEKHLPDR